MRGGDSRTDQAMNRALPATSTPPPARDSAIRVSFPRARRDWATLSSRDRVGHPPGDEVDENNGEFHADGHNGEDSNRTRQEVEFVEVRQGGEGGVDESNEDKRQRKYDS